MPSPAELKARGGVVRIRTKRLPDGRTVTVYVVRKAGPHGGHTLTGEPRRPSRAAKT